MKQNRESRNRHKYLVIWFMTKVAMQSSEKRMIFLLNGTVYVENPTGFTHGKNEPQLLHYTIL